ncbi:MAG TPA: hypothetical protein VF548_01490 [Allosphingosinicella sp.]|jgi:hypothetical protein
MLKQSEAGWGRDADVDTDGSVGSRFAEFHTGETAPCSARIALDSRNAVCASDDHNNPVAKYPSVLKVIIVRAPDRGQLRGQITGAKTVRTVAYPSKKNREARYGEGAAEIERIKAEEVDIHIVKAIAQPCRIHALIDGWENWATHIPDFSNLRDSGERVLIDAKRNWSDFRKPNGQRQSFLGQLAAEALGYRYERIVLGTMGSQVRRDNVDEIQASRFVHVPDHLVARAAAAVAKGPISLGNLADLLHPVNGRSMVYALMVRRIVEIDLEARLTLGSECIAVKPLPLAMPSLRR